MHIVEGTLAFPMSHGKTANQRGHQGSHWTQDGEQ